MHTFEQSNIDQFLTFAQDWEEKNALEVIAQRKESGRTREDFLRPTELYAMLELAGALVVRGEYSQLYDTLKANKTYLRLTQLSEAPSGLLAFSIDPDQSMRLWLEKQASITPMSSEMSSTKTAKKLLQIGIERQDWDGVSVLLGLAPDLIKGSALPNIVLGQLAGDGNDSPSMFQFFHRMLDIKGSLLWKAEDREYPLVLLTTILDNSRYRACLLRPDYSRELLAWTRPLLASLLPLEQDEEADDNGKGEGRVFEDAFKRLVHFLLETIQQGNVHVNCRESAFVHAVSLLQHFLTLGDQYEAGVAADAARISAQIATLHASLLASFALRGRLPNTMEVVSNVSSSRKAALSLIKDIFEMDCSNLSTGLLLLSNVTIDHQTRYKALIKRHSGKNGTNLDDASFDALFQDAARSLDIAPWIPPDLWRESYNAFRPSDDVGLFVQPLARLSTFVQPQLSSHLVSAKTQHADLASFAAYKERLKACLVSLTRRLRSMRGNLPQVLLDISDESGLDSRASEMLSTISYKLADCIIQANLCPEPDIHRAAQNIVRSTFEEAETRGDCFRALLQISPALTLQGIEQYLESFLIAASTLVEANDAAKWMVRSFSDVVDVLCSQTEGLLREGTPHSLVDNSTARPHVRRLLPSIWRLMCRSIAIIFKRTPNWSRVLPHAELTAWFRDVLLFASELVEQVGLVQAAAVHEVSDDEEIQANILLDIAIPLEEASSWFRMNDREIVTETRDFFVKGLLCFNREVELPRSVKQRMLDFIDGQKRIEDHNQRMTLLSLRELSELRHLLDPQEVIEIQDSDEDTATTASFKTPPRDVEPVGVVINKAETESNKAQAPEVLASRPEGSEQRLLKQKKLSFTKVDPSVSRPFITKPAPLPPRPQFASTHAPANRYSGASTKSASSSKTSNAFAEARRSFNASSVWKNSNVKLNSSRPVYPLSNRELPDPKAPAAKRTFTGAPLEQLNVPATRSVSKESESSDDESDEEQEPMGLADLIGQKKSPIKMRSKLRTPQKSAAPARRTVLKEDLEEKRRQREREEVERKRKLRERVNLRPLHKTILSWDIYADGPRPPVQGNTASPRYDTLKSIYKNPQEYVELFEPMLWLEAWAELQSAKGELQKGSNATSSVHVAGRTATDSFVVLAATLQVQHGTKPITYNDADIVFLREAGTSSTSVRPKCILAKVDAYKFDASRKADRLTLRCCIQHDTQGMNSLLAGGASLEMGKLFSLTTLHREYEALQVMQYYNLVPSILMARCSVREVIAESDIRHVEADYGVNRPQAEAILASLKAEQGFNLIQGPPGTGKTKTICSLVAHFIQTRKDAAVPIRAGQAGAGSVIKKKILLCAPSNAAVDEVARRVHEGVKLKNGKIIKPSVVRLGREEAMNISVKGFSLESVVERKLASSGTSSQPDATDDVATVQAEIRRLADERNTKRAELENARLTKMNEKIISQLDSEVKGLSSRRLDMMARLDEVKDKRQTVHRQHTADRKRIEQDVLAEADVVCATLGGAGHNLLCDLPFDFETVVIDEAAQAVEMDTLIPLRYGCQRCILVGDPNQLPPTVISQEAEKLRYSKSLFVRLFYNPSNYSNLLSIQYRMHPTISKFPSTEFYEGKLTDGPEMARLTAKPWHRDPLLGPFRFFHCANSREASGRGNSLINREEALLAAAVYERLRKEALRLGNYSMDGKVGVISMYKEQIFELKRAFESIYGKGIDNVVDFNTVDGFQGQEKDAIILSCVRSNGLGFLSDFRRVNVAITRAKANLFVIGNADNLERSGKGTIWPGLIQTARAQECYMTVTRDMFQRPGVAPSPAPLPAHLPATNGVAGPSPPCEKAVSPVKRKASATFSPLDVAPKANNNNKRLHLDESAAKAKQQNGRSITHQTTSLAARSHITPSAARPRPPASSASRPPTLLHRPSSMQRPAGQASSRQGQATAVKRPVPILPPGQVANAPRPPPRPVELNRAPYRPPRYSSQEGPSEKAKSSLFMPKPNRQNKHRKG